MGKRGQIYLLADCPLLARFRLWPAGCNRQIAIIECLQEGRWQFTDPGKSNPLFLHALSR